MQRVGCRAQVMHGNAKMTGGGLRKKDLKYNKQGKIVSKKMSKLAKKEKRLQKAGYTTRKGQFGAVRIMKGGGSGRLPLIPSENLETLETNNSVVPVVPQAKRVVGKQIDQLAQQLPNVPVTTTKKTRSKISPSRTQFIMGDNLIGFSTFINFKKKNDNLSNAAAIIDKRMEDGVHSWQVVIKKGNGTIMIGICSEDAVQQENGFLNQPFVWAADIAKGQSIYHGTGYGYDNSKIPVKEGLRLDCQLDIHNKKFKIIPSDLDGNYYEEYVFNDILSLSLKPFIEIINKDDEVLFKL